jgi:hypothetical protein
MAASDRIVLEQVVDQDLDQVVWIVTKNRRSLDIMLKVADCS